MDSSTKTLRVDLFGHVQMPVIGAVVIEVPVDTTEDEIHGLAEQLEGLVQQWEDADGVREDPDHVIGAGQVEVTEVGEEADFTFIRNGEGKLVLKE